MTLVVVAPGLVMLGAGCAIAFRARPRIAGNLFRVLVIAGCAGGALQAVAVLRGQLPPIYTFSPPLPWGAWEVGLDRLSAWFLLIIALVGGATVWGGVSYLAHHGSDGRVGYAHACAGTLVASMMALTMARAAVPFLVAWELMAVTAYLLIIFENDRPEVRQAGLLYLVLTHAGALALVAMFLVWGQGAPDFTFRSLAASGATTTTSAAVILLLATVGFGVKAGLVPLHIWLPGAHAAAPTHVSALMSGVLIKTGIYGLLRTVQLLGVVPAWWGWSLLLIGLVTGVLGVLWAIAQDDLKRVLAYSSVENVGIVVLSLGAGVLGIAYRQPLIATLGLAGALLHALNHALFKSLLFLGAGVVAQASGTRALDRMGGLARRMPWTAAAFLAGALAISGLPPFNGFISEWTVVRGLLAAQQGTGAVRLVVVAAGGVGLIAALALACFARLVAVIFLGQPREHAGQPGDPDLGLRLPMAALALACGLIGLAPVVALDPLRAALADFPGAGMPEVIAPPWTLRLSLAWMVLLGLIAVGMGWRVGRARGRTVSSVTWGCAYGQPSARMQYTASSFSAPLLWAFSPRARPPMRREDSRLETQADGRALGVLSPAWALVERGAAALRPIQHGRITSYLLYMVLTVLVLLLLLAVVGLQAS